jgi:hypothetical protein
MGGGRLLLVSPPVLFVTVWTVASLIAWRVLSHPEQNDLAHLFIARHRLDLDAFAARPIVWALVLTGALGLGYALAGLGLGPAGAPLKPVLAPAVVARRLFWVNTLFLAVTVLWVSLTMQAAGGPHAFIRLVGVNPLAARDLLLDRKLFTGMRLLYAGLPATAALSAALLVQDGLGRRGRTLCITILALNLAALFLLTLVMSQRLLVMQLVVSAFVAASVSRGRLLAYWTVPLAAFVFALGWTLHESLTNPGILRPVTEIAAQKFAFYAVNDLWNTVRPLMGDAPHGNGLFTFQFALFFTLTDGFVYAAHADRLEALLAFRGGGEFSLLSAPYVDFGPAGAAAYLIAYGALMRVLWHRATFGPGDAAIYGQAATALLLSVHANFVASQDFVFAVLIIWLVTRIPAQVRHSALAPHAAT